MYGVLVNKLKFSPSEVRQMTLGEAYAIIESITAIPDEVEERMALGRIKGLFK